MTIPKEMDKFPRNIISKREVRNILSRPLHSLSTAADISLSGMTEDEDVLCGQGRATCGGRASLTPCSLEIAIDPPFS